MLAEISETIHKICELNNLNYGITDFIYLW